MMRDQKKVKKAVAIQYDAEKMEAPQVKAKGEGELAKEIIRLAREHHIPIYEDPSLAELLHKIELNDQIPEELYAVMAEILAMVYRLDSEVGNIDRRKHFLKDHHTANDHQYGNRNQ